MFSIRFDAEESTTISNYKDSDFFNPKLPDDMKICKNIAFDTDLKRSKNRYGNTENVLRSSRFESESEFEYSEYGAPSKVSFYHT